MKKRHIVTQPLAAATLLVAQVASDLHDDATVRVDRIEDRWDTTETFLATE